jgi:acyl-CoA thioesterase-2
MSKTLDGLLELLDLEELEVNLFRGRSPDEDRQRVFGGQVAGQALVAAYRTVEKGSCHSLHAYFLRPGDPRTPIVYLVDRIRDGRSFTTRRSQAIQHGKPIFHLTASFQPEEPGPEHQAAMPDVPEPESLTSFEDWMAEQTRHLPTEQRALFARERPFEMRWVDPVNPLEPSKRAPRQQIWIRARGRLPAHPLYHQCTVVYVSDMTLIDTAVMPHGIAWSDDCHQMASLDHAMWFHRPFRADDWLLYDQQSPNAYGARGFTMGHLYTREGELVVSVVQEGLVRRRREGAR